MQELSTLSDLVLRGGGRMEEVECEVRRPVVDL